MPSAVHVFLQVCLPPQQRSLLHWLCHHVRFDRHRGEHAASSPAPALHAQEGAGKDQDAKRTGSEKSKNLSMRPLNDGPAWTFFAKRACPDLRGPSV